MRALMLLPIAMLAACDAAPPPAPAPKPKELSDFQRQIAEMDAPRRQIVLIRAIRDADKDCQGVVKEERQPDLPTGELLYTATCTDGTPYAVTFQREGTARVMSRTF